MPNTKFDLIIIGGGPAGYVGAIRAAQLGKTVACIERDKLGGVCLNWGCIPTKALLKNAEIYTEIAKHADSWGLNVENLSYNWEKIIARSRGVSDTLNKGIEFLFKKNNITHFAGHAKITRAWKPTNPCQVQIYDKPAGGKILHTLTSDKILIATGGTPRQLPFAPYDGKYILSAKDAMTISIQPKKLVIIGAGAIGVEFAYFYNAFGTEVTLIEMLDQILPIEDQDISKLLTREFKKSKINIKTSHTVTAVDINNNNPEPDSQGNIQIKIAKVTSATISETIEADAVLIAVGVRGRYDGLFDDTIGIETYKDHIKVDDYLDSNHTPTYQTTAPGIYAVGDVIGPPWLAHVASDEAVTCVERMYNHECLGLNYKNIPGCTYCHPQVASVGKTEKALIADGLKLGEDYAVGAYPLKAHGKAIASSANIGLVKILTSIPHGEILGAHIIGDQATEMIGEFTLARSLEATAQDLIDTIHAHPTMYEAIHEAALATQNRIIHG